MIGVLDHYVPPVAPQENRALLAAGDVRRAAENVVPSEMYLVARELAPNDHDSPLAARHLRMLAAEAPEELSPRAISHAFGTPKPLLSTSYQPELLNLRTFPTLMGYSSRILAESWESNLLFYAALADEVHMRPAELNLRVPNGPSRPWNIFSPRISRIGRRCCARCAWWATTCAKRRASRWSQHNQKTE